MTDKDTTRRVTATVAAGHLADVFDAACLLNGRRPAELVRDVMTDYLIEQADEPDIQRLIEIRDQRANPKPRPLRLATKDEPAAGPYFEPVLIDGDWAVMVPTHAHPNMVHAAAVVLVAAGADPKYAEGLARHGVGHVFSEHLAEPDGCACDSAGDWCRNGDGRTETFFTFDAAVVARLNA